MNKFHSVKSMLYFIYENFISSIILMSLSYVLYVYCNFILIYILNDKNFCTGVT